MQILILFSFLIGVGSLSMGAATAQGTNTAQGFRAETVAILPWIYQKGTQNAIKTAKASLHTMLSDEHFEIRPESRTIATWTIEMGQTLEEDRTDLPNPTQLIELGQRLGVDWVITGRAFWRTRSVWIGLSLRTKSTCTVDLLVIDVKQKQIAYSVNDVDKDSTSKGSVVVGGPKSPQEERAVELAIQEALKPWLEKHRSTRMLAAASPAETIAQPPSAPATTAAAPAEGGAAPASGTGTTPTERTTQPIGGPPAAPASGNLNTAPSQPTAGEADVEAVTLPIEVSTALVKALSEQLRTKEEKRSLAVLEFSIVNVNTETAKRLSASLTKPLQEDLITAFIQQGILVVEQSKLDQVMREAGQTGVTNEKLMEELGKRLPDSLVVTGSISQRGQDWIINARVVDTQKGVGIAATMQKVPVK